MHLIFLKAIVTYNIKYTKITGVDSGYLERGFICKIFADFMISNENENNLVSLRPNYFIYLGYLKMGDGEGVRVNPLNPLFIRHCIKTTCC